VTVCIAAIFENHGIIGASDRMISTVDIAYEPERPKIVPVTNSIAIQYAGDASMASMVCHAVVAEVSHQIRERPDEWVPVRRVAELWATCYRREVTREAEDAVLAPLGLTLESFSTSQRQMTPELVTRLASSLTSHKSRSVSAIVAGVDTSGPHIFMANGTRLTCSDHSGYAAIGIGDWHASSQFMFASHAPQRSLAATTWLTYMAKRYSEAAPGVGAATDMFAILGLGGNTDVGPHILGELERVYKKRRASERQIAQRAENAVAQYFDQLLPKETPAQTALPEAAPVDEDTSDA
jgi:20S proteasome alpha/beta subunit